MPQVGRPSAKDFLFDSLGSKTPLSERKVHIRRLADILQICLHKKDWSRARKAWTILARCPEYDWKSLWQTGLLLVASDKEHVENAGDAKRLEYLRVMMLRSPVEERVIILQELILWFIKAGRQQEGLDELELYLPSFPYNEVPALHIYAGFLCLWLARSAKGTSTTTQAQFNLNELHKCKTHLRRASELDPEHPVTKGLLANLEKILEDNNDDDYESEDMDQTGMVSLDESRPAKKQR
ncbi:hypothetical protein M422DRAFT_23077 [Sphaerobolus stellatus SS14]|nr:hypothetical protein M422DRAFT_23077 [Sphaerobolus stellatus SS14]